MNALCGIGGSYIYLMTKQESTAAASLIWDYLFSVKNEDKDKDKEWQINIIESVIIKVGQEQRKVGRTQIINHIKTELKNIGE